MAGAEKAEGTEPTPLTVEYLGQVWAPLRLVDDFGLKALDLVGAPRRLTADDITEPLYCQSVDLRRVRSIVSPARQLRAASSGESWLSVSSKGLARLHAAFLLGEDPQRRLDATKSAALMHQMSLVQHVLESSNLARVLIADEVGLGKTIEAGMIVKRVLEQTPRARVLYLAPARLVSNVVSEFRDKLDLDARRWVAGNAGDARLDSDQLIVASIHKAVFGENADRVRASGPWDVLIVDECHHLSDWGAGGGKPNRSYKLVSELIAAMPRTGRLLLLSGTPHQGSVERFENLLRLLVEKESALEAAAGRVIYRTKERVRDWRGRPLFPSRNIRTPGIVNLGDEYQAWYSAIAELYDRPDARGSAARAAGWAKGQALQWAASSIEAGLGFLVRLAIRRLGWTPREAHLAKAIAALRPYRGGAVDEPVDELFQRLVRQTGLLAEDPVAADAEGSEDSEEGPWLPDPLELKKLLAWGVRLLSGSASEAKWHALRPLLDEAGSEKVVLFAQPVETVTVVAAFLERTFGHRPAVIIGNQTEEERQSEVARFRRSDGPRFMVSSRAGGEGLNLQVARRLIHVDVPWNPMELEQRIGRVHRFGSHQTILVDTIVVAGTREVDMYRVAREKLRLIATQIDPEQFEALFSRVMSLVPPKELELLLGSQPVGPLTDRTTERIGALVRQGYAAWSEFDARYQSQADQIRALEPGAATWADLEDYLVRNAGARRAGAVRFTSFAHELDEIVANHEYVPGLELGGTMFVCADTGGMPGVAESGGHVPQVGLNLDPVRAALRTSILAGECGAAYLNRSTALSEEFPDSFVVLGFLRQAVSLNTSQPTERRLSLHLFLVPREGDARELNGAERGRITRLLMTATRVRDPRPGDLVQRTVDVEQRLVDGLRRPTESEIQERVRAAVWPIAAIVVEKPS